MPSSTAGLFSGQTFIPHGYCLSWDPWLLWSIAGSDLLIGLSYYSIPIAILFFIRRHKTLKFNWVFWMFGLFILACGTTHFIHIADIWYPAYRLDAIALLVTAGISVSTAIMLWPLVPEASAFLLSREAAEKNLLDVNRRLEISLVAVQRANQQMAVLGELSSILQACQHLHEVGQPIGHFGEQLFRGYFGVLYLTQTPRNYLAPIASWGTRYDAGDLFDPEACWALRRGRAHWGDSEDGLRCTHRREPSSGAGQSRLSFCGPIIASGETLGVLCLDADDAPQSETAPEARDQLMRLAEVFVDRIGIAIANVKLRQTLHLQSIRDPLTALFNRRYLEESMSRELAAAKRNATTVTVMMIDIDDFKKFNDRHGHAAGDHVLQQVALLLGSRFRGSDIACRFGGEEFALVMPGASLEQAIAKAEEFRSSVGAMPLVHAGETLPSVFVSVGVAAYPLHGDEGGALIHAADLALYRAKHEGRNRIVCADDPASERAPS